MADLIDFSEKQAEKELKSHSAALGMSMQELGEILTLLCDAMDLYALRSLDHDAPSRGGGFWRVSVIKKTSHD